MGRGADCVSAAGTTSLPVRLLMSSAVGQCRTVTPGGLPAPGGLAGEVVEAAVGLCRTASAAAAAGHLGSGGGLCIAG
jgi:hypothetical protein